MNKEDIEALIQRLTSLPMDQQETAILSLINDLNKLLPEKQIEDMRDAILKELGDCHDAPIVKATLNLIEGQLALRKLGNNEWR